MNATDEQIRQTLVAMAHSGQIKRYRYQGTFNVPEFLFGIIVGAIIVLLFV